MDYTQESLRMHGEWKGKIEVVSRVPVDNEENLALAYTPGVALPCLEIRDDPQKSYLYTRRHGQDHEQGCDHLRMCKSYS